MRRAMNNDQKWKQEAIRRFTLAAVLLVAGLVIVILAGSGVLRILGWAVVAAAISIAVSLAFLEIGYSEDRARSNERRGRPLHR